MKQEELNEKLKEIAKLPTQEVAVALFDLVAPMMNYETNPGRVLFHRTKGTPFNDSVHVPQPLHSHDEVMLPDGKTMLKVGRRKNNYAAVQNTYHQYCPDVNTSVRFSVNNIQMWMTYGAPGQFTKNAAGDLVPDPHWSPTPIKPVKGRTSGSNIEMDEGATVILASERAKYCFMMLHPQCSVSPFQIPEDNPLVHKLKFVENEIDRFGIKVRQPSMTPNVRAAKMDIEDEDGADAMRLSAALWQQTESELSNLVKVAKVGGIRPDSKDKKKNIIAKMEEVVRNRSLTKDHRAQYEKLRDAVFGHNGIASTLSTIELARKLGILTIDDDGSSFSLNGEFVEWSVMDDPNAGATAVKGRESEWLARKVASHTVYDAWMIELEHLVGEAQKAKIENLNLSDPKRQLLSKAIDDGVIIGYDPERTLPGGKANDKDKNYRWAIDNKVVCTAHQWGSKKNESTLKKFLGDLVQHFADYDLDTLASVIEEKTPKAE